MQHKRKTHGLFDISYEQLISLFKPRKTPEGAIKALLYTVGILATPLSAIGALWGYVRAYNRHLRSQGEYPTLASLKPISRVAMILGAIFIWIVIALGVYAFSTLFNLFFSNGLGNSPMAFILPVLNFILTAIALLLFRRWQNRIAYSMQDNNRFGSARWAKAEELADLKGQEGLYIGGLEYAYKKMGHILTVAGTRAGKFVNLIAPHLLGMSGYNGSSFIIDVKGEITAVTSRFQRKKGNRVLILDPWGLNPMGSASYNPLDLLSGQTNLDRLCDDASMIAEMIVPKELKSDQFWDSRARSLISGMILHLVTAMPKDQHHLGMIWKWLRLPDEEWLELLADMAVSDNEIVRASGNEFIGLMKTAEKTFASILSTARDKTDFLKSPALRESLQSSTFDINTLSDGKTTLYVIIPPDQLDAQGQWLRLVFSTALTAVVRNRNKRVTFLLDECAALGYLPQLKTAFSTYAGYDISMWPIFQDLAQVKSIYGEAWETFISNAAVRQYFGINDEFTSSYLEKLVGTQTVVTHEATQSGSKPNASARPLATADEIRRGSANYIFTFIEQRPPTYFEKAPYYEMPELYDRYDDNPFYNPQ